MEFLSVAFILLGAVLVLGPLCAWPMFPGDCKDELLPKSWSFRAGPS